MNDPLDSQSLGALLRKARKQQGLTQAALAGLCNTGVRFIVDLEAGKPTCRLGLALKVAHKLGVRFAVELPNV